MMLCKHHFLYERRIPGSNGAVWLHDEERCGFLMSLPEPHLTAAREMMSLAADGGSTPIRCDFRGQPPCPYYEP